MVLLAAVLATMAAAPPELTTAETAMSKYKYGDALAALKKARVAKGLDRTTLLRILELQGIAAGQQRQSAQAVAAFTELLTLDPGHKLDGDFAPRVTTPFLEAGQTVTEQGALEPKPGLAMITGRKVTGLVVEVARDPLKQVRSVVFHVEAGSGWRSESTTIGSGKASIAVDAPEVSWWAELMGDNDSQLALVGSQRAPIVAAPPPPMVVATPPPPPPAPEVVKPATASGSPLRTVSFVVAGAGLAAAGVGVFFGLRSSSTFQAIAAGRAQKDAAGNVTGITERDATTRGAQAATDGTLANALFIGAGALVATGVVLFFVGAPSDTHALSLSVTPAGLVFSGSFQ